MKKTFISSILALMVAVIALPSYVLAANEASFDADTTLDMVDPDVNLTILSGSVVDSITVNNSSLDVTISSSGTLTVRSTDRKKFTHNSNSLAIDTTCNDSYSQIQVTGSGSGNTFAITVSSDTCSSSGGGGGGGGSSGGGGGSTTVSTPTQTTTPAPTTSTPPAPQTAAEAQAMQKQQMADDAESIFSGSITSLLTNTGMTRNEATETKVSGTYTKALTSGVQNIGQGTITAITNFVTYGTGSTKKLGAGERAGVISSYKAAFGKLPTSESGWSDIVKIANGRWPSETSSAAEAKAKVEFKKVYKKEANMMNANDNAAVTVIAYGLRPSARNTNSEKAAIKSYKAIYKVNPKDATSWDIVRAIAYSGAKR